MGLRDEFATALKTAMKARDAAASSTLRMVLARVKDADIVARPKGITAVPDEEIVGLLRGMVKSRRESIDLYRQGNRPELVEKEEAEIALIESFLPSQMDEAAMTAAVAQAVAETGAASVKEMGKVMAVLKQRHAASLDMARAGALVRAQLGG